MFQNVDFSYTNSYDEKKMIELVGNEIKKNILRGGYDPLNGNIEDAYYGTDLSQKPKDIINYYIGHHYKCYKTINEIEYEMGWVIDPYYPLDEYYYHYIANYLINKRVNNVMIEYLLG